MAVLFLTACAGADGTDGGAIRENVIEPGLEAIDESKVQACELEASSFRTALEIYEISTGEPAPNEAALVEGGQLRQESELWDVVDGELVAEDPACGDVSATVPTAEIVTDEDASGALAVEDVLTGFTDADIASMGGTGCARELAIIIAGASQYTEREGVGPDTLADLEAGGHLVEPVSMWEVVDDTLRPAADSSCVDFVAAQAAADQARACGVESRTLEVAREAYIAQFGDEPTRQDLVDAEFIRPPEGDKPIVMDLIDGVVQPAAGEACDGVDLTPPAVDVSTSPDDCTTARRTLEVAVEAFFAQNGELPRAENDLVTGGMLREPLTSHDLGPDASVVPAPGGGCE